MNPKKIEVRLAPHEMQYIPIVADAAISSCGHFGGRLVPLVILDTSNRPDIEELIRNHYVFQGSGDVEVQWAELQNRKGFIALFLKFVRPFEATAIIEFDIVKHGILVEQVLIAKGLYIQSGRKGDRLMHDLDRPKVILEVPDTGFIKSWDEMFNKHLIADFRSKGLNRSDAKRAAQSAIGELRKFNSFRMRDQPPSSD